jgi:hypothetical protein
VAYVEVRIQVRIPLRTIEVSNMANGKKVCFRNRTAAVLMLTRYSCKLIENGHTSIHENPLKYGSVSSTHVRGSEHKQDPLHTLE